MTPVLIVSSKTGGSKSINLAHSHTVNSHTHTTKDHTLTVDEIPSHHHQLPRANYIGSGYNYPNELLASISQVAGGNPPTKYTGDTGGGEAHNHGTTSASSPGTNSKLSTSQSILNPYIVSAKWIRVS